MATLSSLVQPNNILTATNTQTITNKTIEDPIITLTSTQGTSGQVISSQGSGQPPVWVSLSSSFNYATLLALS
jgi:hypothetical protein